MATISSGTELARSYYLRNFYAYNRSAIKSSGRADFSHVELSYEDSRALHKAAKSLEKIDYSGLEKGENIYNNIMAFIDTYNNTLDSAKNVDSDSSNRNAKRLKNLVKKYKDELDDIGISIEKNGNLKANENLVKGASLDNIKKVFGKDSNFTSELKSISKKMNSGAFDDIYTAITQTGTHINITL